jgi:crotonobetainyl-CoA:carnitine CoA-transferase CaiB-like acyl-CoA transferase
MIGPVWNPLADNFVAASAAGFPLKFSQTPGNYDRPAPLPGEHTDEVLARLAGVGPAEALELRRAGTV